MTLLMFSIGVPMISGGDELCRTQNGNNNSYCQDDEISWYNWELDEDQKRFMSFVQKLVKTRQEQLTIQRKEFFKGEVDEDGTPKKDVAWFLPSGKSMTEKNWEDSENRCLGVLFEGRAVHETDVAHGTEAEGNTLFLISNMSHVGVPFTLPTYKYLNKWEVLVDTSKPERAVEEWKDGEIPPRTVMLLMRS